MIVIVAGHLLGWSILSMNGEVWISTSHGIIATRDMLSVDDAMSRVAYYDSASTE